ncbi:uncharacterized protein LOC106656525 [Trichogramma pretiosum]|uniref:uncharacterized protein LOC106656525 n=1 Tax=Trichogramma pretiosum TaxID=7493 RepID=UPI0006C96159|nr:uncharacterized protein LOC106656525 [Trichogramma pretiosum]
MESSGNVIRVKKEANDTWLDANVDKNFNSVESWDVKNCETSEFHKSSENEALRMKLDEEIFIDFDYKNVKLELESLSISTCNTECQSYSPIVKVEDQIRTSYSNERELNIPIEKELDCNGNAQFREKVRSKIDELKTVKLLKKKMEPDYYTSA